MTIFEQTCRMQILLIKQRLRGFKGTQPNKLERIQLKRKLAALENLVKAHETK